MAMHIHSSFSELYGSMDGQLNQAQRNGVDVIWWSEHDTKMDGLAVKHEVHFTSLTDEQGDGRPWQWEPFVTGEHTSAATGGIDEGPGSPRDPIRNGSMRVVAEGRSSDHAAYAMRPANVPSVQTWRSNLTQQKIELEVLATSVGSDAYLEIRIDSSLHPASGGRSEGVYALSYRIGGPGAPGTRTSVDRLGIVTLDVPAQEWSSVVLEPEKDLEALFPDLDARDFSLFALRLGAVSLAGARASGNFDYLRFRRPVSGEALLRVQRDIGEKAAGKYAKVTQQYALEVSHGLPHVNWFGGNVTLPTYDGYTGSDYLGYVAETVIPDIHEQGGLASYNHPYGVGWGPALPQATQDQMLTDLATRLLPLRAAGADIMEVGYPNRQGVDLAHHVALWDVMSRNGIFLTGNGVSDDHAGVDWRDPPTVTTWTTSAWADDTEETTLLGALQAGRVWCQSMTGFHGGLDLMVDDRCPMGSVSVSGASTRELSVTAIDVPEGGSLTVLQGDVDYAGTDSPASSARSVGRLSSGDVGSGTAKLSLDTRESSFVRAEVRNAAGDVVALSNPVWLLRDQPPRPIPDARAV